MATAPEEFPLAANTHEAEGNDDISSRPQGAISTPRKQTSWDDNVPLVDLSGESSSAQGWAD
ncbi:hypothetical protein ACH419_30710, partial [Streptomyces bobili]|uniref:hypothetical protein n=1 Tax=Streptomyces bobili TaxID=67280 RepID=UPI0037A9C20B